MIEEEYYDSGIPYQENIKGIASMVTFPFTLSINDFPPSTYVS
jgi:hypothetical protein